MAPALPIWSRERITLVVEQEALRLLGVQGSRVTRWGSTPLPRDVLTPQGEVASGERLAQVLERLWASQTSAQPAARPALILAVPGHHIASTVVPLPAPDADAALLAQTAHEALPQPDAYHAWQEIGAARQRSLFVVAAPQTLVDGYVQAVERAGLGISAIDVKPLALIRGVGERHAIIVDSERGVGTIIIVAEALPRQVRFLPLALPLLASPEDKAMRLVEAVHFTVQQYNRGEHSLHPATPIFLTGTLAEEPLLREGMTRVLGHPLGQLQPQVELPPDLPTSQFVANLGLALKRLD